MTKKFLSFIAMLAVASMLSAENQTTSCESKYGTCSFELSDKDLRTNCVCYDERDFTFTDPFPEDGSFTDTLPTEEWCQKTIDDLCKIPAQCSNDAGSCDLEKNGDYNCYCLGVEETKTGTTNYFGEEGCNKLLVEMCGEGSPTLRKVCPKEILNECVSYFERIHNTCLDPIDINEILDTPITYGSPTTVEEFADCCNSEYWRKEYKRESDCIETFETCENKECCECTLQVGDAANTDGATPEDTADRGKKEETKSDGCSLLFI